MSTVLIHQATAKLFAATTLGFDAAAYIPIFHAWIRHGKLAGKLWIDVTDYKHVPAGPGVMLIAHEGHLALDEAGSRLGLRWSRKRDPRGPLGERLLEAVADVVAAAIELEREPTSPLRFPGAEIEIGIQDRLTAPNTDAVHAELAGELAAIAGRLYPGAEVSIERVSADPREPFAVRLRSPVATELATLQSRLR